MRKSWTEDGGSRIEDRGSVVAIYLPYEAFLIKFRGHTKSSYDFLRIRRARNDESWARNRNGLQLILRFSILDPPSSILDLRSSTPAVRRKEASSVILNRRALPAFRFPN